MDAYGYTILEGMGDPIGMVPHVQLDEMVGTVPPSLPTLTNGEWFLGVSGMFPGEEHLRAEANRTNWNPIVNTGDEARDVLHRDMGAARYQSTNHFVTKVLEENGNVDYAYKRAHIDVWIGMLASMLHLDNASRTSDIDSFEPLYIPVTGGRYLFTGKDCDVQVGHNEFAQRPTGKTPGYFVMVTGPEAVSLYVVDHSHNWISYPEETKKILIENQHLKKITIPGNSVFFGHGYLHHAGAGYSGSNCLRYHTYIRPEEVELPDAIHFSHGNGSATVYTTPGRRTKVFSRPRGNDNESSQSRVVNHIATSPSRKRVTAVSAPIEDDNEDDVPDDDMDMNDDDEIVAKDVRDA